MKRLLVIAVAALPLAACASIGPVGSVADGADRFQSGVTSAATAPLEDLNLRREEIPEALIDARYRPYSVDGMGRCDAIAAEIARLDDALGADFDTGASGDGATLAEMTAEGALGVVRDTATDFIPMRSWVRRLTGAHAHSQQVQHAIRAGLARRAFLKGVGQMRNCAPPAAPRGFTPASAPAIAPTTL